MGKGNEGDPTDMQTDLTKNIYDVLAGLGIEYQKYDHPAVHTMEDLDHIDQGIDAARCKNLFLRNYKGDAHYLVVVEGTRKIDLQQLSSLLGESKLSFASPERMMKYLGLEPGSVSPFGLIHDTSHAVRVLIDQDLLKQDRLSFHPNINTSTLVIKTDDFQRFLDSMGNTVRYIGLQ